MKRIAPVLGMVVVAVAVAASQDVGAQAVNCANPTPQDCLNATFTKSCPNLSQAAKTTCQNANKQAFQNTLNTMPNSKPDKIFEHSGDKFTPGKRSPASNISKTGTYKRQQVAAAAAAFKNETSNWHGQENHAYTEAQSTNKQPAQFIRSGITAGDDIQSCEDYVYKMYFDQERWADAVYACKDDVRCEADVSLLGAAPGLANHQMMDKDKPPRAIADPDHLMGALNGYLARNEFFDMTGIFIPGSLIQAFSGDPAKLASMNALATALRTGFMDYYLGQGVSGGSPVNAQTQGFSGEWDFDAVMNTRTRQNFDGEFYEYARRNKSVLSDVMDFGEYLKEAEPPQIIDPWLTPNTPTHPTAPPTTPNAVGGLGETRLYDWTDDAFLTRQVIGNIDASHLMHQGAVLQKYPQLAQIIAADKDISTGLRYAGLVNPPAALDPNGGRPVPTNGVQLFNTQPSPFEKLFQRHPPPIDTNVKYPRLVCPNITDLLATLNENNPSRSQVFRTATAPTAGNQKFYGDPILCELINRILIEWHRHEANLGSCFDTNNFACDWSPRDFVKRWKRSLLGMFNKQKEKDYAECKSWLTQIFRPYTQGPGKKTWNSDPVSVTDARSRMCSEETGLKRELRGVPIKDNDVFGEEHVDQQTYGDHNFNVNYHYDYGWDTRIFRRYSDDHNPCEFGGRMHGEFDAGATAFGNGINVFNANFDLDVNDDGNTNGSRVGTPTGKVLIDGKSEFLGYTIYDLTSDNLSWSLNQSGKTIPVVPHHYEKDLVVAVPIPIGPIDVTLSVYIGWGYGVKAKLDGKASTCRDGEKDPKPKQGGDATLALIGSLKPSGEIDLDASVDVSVMGFGGGVECDLTLLGVDLPLITKSEIAVTNNSAQLTFDLNLDAKLHTLDGEFSVYLTAPIVGQVASWKIGGWTGLQFDFDLLNAKSPPINLNFLVPGLVSPKGMNPTSGACCDPRTQVCPS